MKSLTAGLTIRRFSVKSAIGSNLHEFAALVKKDRAKWDGIICAANIRLD